MYVVTVNSCNNVMAAEEEYVVRKGQSSIHGLQGGLLRATGPPLATGGIF